MRRHVLRDIMKIKPKQPRGAKRLPSRNSVARDRKVTCSVSLKSSLWRQIDTEALIRRIKPCTFLGRAMTAYLKRLNHPKKRLTRGPDGSPMIVTVSPKKGGRS